MNEYERLSKFIKYTYENKIFTSIWYDNEGFRVHVIIYKDGKRKDMLEQGPTIDEMLNKIKTRLKTV